jgi:hypothetical protein
MYASFAFFQKCQTWHDIAWGKWGEVDNKSMFNCCGKPNFPINPDIPRWICVLPSACIWVCRTCVRQYWVLQKRIVYCWTWPTYRWLQVLKFWLCNSSSEDVCPVRCWFQSFDTSAYACRHLLLVTHQKLLRHFFLLLIALPKILRSIKRIGRFKQDVKPTSIIQGHDKTMGDQLVGTFIWWKLPFMAAKNGWWAAIFSLLPVYLNVFFMYS